MRSSQPTIVRQTLTALAVLIGSVGCGAAPALAQRAEPRPAQQPAARDLDASLAPYNAARAAAAAATALPATPAHGAMATQVAEPLEITSADKISVKIQGQPELSGDYRINDDQTISIPVLGRVPVAHLDAASLEKVLNERLSRLMGRESYVTVEVVDYRPVFVSGYVSRPGTAPWKPGMTVLQAVTITGGIYRSPNASGIDGTDNKLQRAIDDQKRVLASIARLTAERNGADKIEVPPRLLALVGRKEAEELIGAQQTSFLSRKNATETQVASLQRSIAIAKEELDNLRSQRVRLMEQLKTKKAQFVQLKALYDKQFLRIEKLSDEETKISDLEEKVASLGVSVSRTEGSLVGLQRDLENVQQDRRAIIDTDLLKLERDAAQLDLEIEAAGSAARPTSRPLSDGDGPKKEVLVYEIVRQDETGPRNIPADRNTLLRPGDMLVVSVQ